ncbi:hypothetical protein AB0M57_04820 [Streptomyces sp. NPDC051597]|uniref:hypothetical protein n=1 Tax=Streptomyces sp. NPDC051597 TaxID=3155049 RepID=UPI00342380D6
MPDMWMPGAERRPVGNTAPMNGGPPRVTWHATSNDSDWSYLHERDFFASGGADVAPHLLWDPFTGQIAQFFPASSRALALKNATGEQTNRTGTYNIQIEVVFTNNESVSGRRYANIVDTPCTGLDRLMAWLRSLGVLDTWPGGAPRAWARQTVSLDVWRTRGGHYGHCHVPGNDHIDPGPMPNLFSTAEDDMTPEEHGWLKDLRDNVGFMVWSYKSSRGRDAYADLGAAADPRTILGYRNPDMDKASVDAGTGHIPDVYGHITGSGTGVKTIVDLIAALQTTALNDQQMQAIATAIAANSALADAIAAKVATDIVARLES